MSSTAPRPGSNLSAPARAPVKAISLFSASAKPVSGDAERPSAARRSEKSRPIFMKRV